MKVLGNRFWMCFLTCALLVLMGASVSYPASSADFKQGLGQLADQLTDHMERESKLYVAVHDFTDLSGHVSELGVFVSEELITYFHRSGRVKVVERRLLEQIMEEHRLALSDLVDEKTVKRLGMLLGVDAVCTGTIADLREVLEINARLIDVETGNIFAAASVELNKSDAFRILMKRYSKARSRIKRQEKPESPQAVSFLSNGDFSDGYSGWVRTIGDMRQGASKTEIVDFQSSNSKKALYIRHEGVGHIQFHQVVNAPSADLLFSATFQANTHEGFIKAFSGTGIAQIGLQYFDRKGYKMGQTVLLNYVKNPFADTPLIGVPRLQRDTYQTHYIEFQGDQIHHNYRIDIQKEIEDNLLGIDPDEVEDIGVILWCGATHPQAGAELWITDISLGMK